MKTAFLKDLGISEQSVIDAIMAENGRDIENVKKNISELETKIEGLNNQLNERDSQLTELKKNVGDNEALSNRISELEELNKTTKADYEKQLEELRRDNEIESKLRDANAKNIKAVKALLNDKDDLDEQIKKLTNDSETSFLFESKTQDPTPPKGTEPASGSSKPTKTEPKTLADAVRTALTGNKQ